MVVSDRMQVHNTGDSFLCMFLELCWSFGADEDFLAQKLESDENLTPMKDAILFLQYLTYYDLMHSGSYSKQTPALFSRQWFSTLPVQNSISNDNESPEDTIVPLPFFPVVPFHDDADKVKIIKHHICMLSKRMKRFCDRLLTRTIIQAKDTTKIQDIKTKLNSIAQTSDFTTFKDAFEGIISSLKQYCDDHLEELHEISFKDAAEKIYGIETLTNKDELYKYIVSAIGMNSIDVENYIRRYNFYLKQITAEINGESLASILTNPKNNQTSSINQQKNIITALWLLKNHKKKFARKSMH